MGKLIDLKGRTFNRLTVLYKVQGSFQCAKWHVRCECGQEKDVYSNSLLNGSTKSCGCYNKENASLRSKTHGLSDSRTYHIWENIKGRANGRCHKEQYFDRGISLCERWQRFENFHEDMGTPPTDKHIIDRVNNLKGYSKENCRWVTPKESIRNRIRTQKKGIHFVTIGGRTLCLKDWAGVYNLKVRTLYARIWQLGWNEEKAITTPIFIKSSTYR